jgi:uncharacterized protein YecT (DUF1311 family)
MRRLTPTQIGLIAAGILILAFVLWTAAATRRGNPDRLPDITTAQATAPSPEKRCAAQSTYDLINRDLFRRAAALRGSDQAAFDKLAAYAVVRMDRPVLESEDVRTGRIACSGTLSLELPPGVAVVGGRRTLDADIGYTLQRAADGNGEVLTLTSADAIITPLATLARVGAPASAPLAPATVDPLAPAPAPAPPVIAPPPRQVARPAAPAPPLAQPSFSCASARTRGEIAVCGDPGLAALDRQMAAQYVAALRTADPATRTALQRSRDRFLAYRDQCPSNACVAETYRGRMREIRDIASGALR